MRRRVPALTVSQWLPGWEKVDFSVDESRRRPPQEFLLFSMEATELRRLIGIQRRSSVDGTPRNQDLGIQRAHEKSRSVEIADYVKYGFPWSKLSPQKRNTNEYMNLVKPGWLPTALVVNILLPEDQREGKSVNTKDLVTVDPQDVPAYIEIPDTTEHGWKPSELPPIEVIDGQHRLWAFDEEVKGYEVPVVAFRGLDRSWQAYLFYTINISPKRINPSLAFDLYPLLRTEDWLERFEGHSVYRETRAQELTEALWSYDESPWFRRINMLGERGLKSVTQASWIRSLLATFVKSWEGRRVQIGGLFGAPVGRDKLVLPWSRAQQAAFLIYAWQELAEAIDDVQPEWVYALYLSEDEVTFLDSGMQSVYSMLNSDMGVRGFLYTLNDLCFVKANKLKLRSWKQEMGNSATSDSDITLALKSLKDLAVAEFITTLMRTLAQYDWRSSKEPNLTPEEHRLKARFRGSGGYRELRQELLQFVYDSAGEGLVGEAADEARRRLGM